MADADALTQLLRQAHGGDAPAAERAYALLYPELLKIARSRLRIHQAPTLLDTHALVHESFLRFVGGTAFAPQSRKHFYAYAAQAMRHIVIDFARRAQAESRGGALQRVTLDSTWLAAQPGPATATPVLDLERALTALQAADASLAELVELRFYGGYTDEEAAQALGVSDRTVRRQWEKARAFLLMHLQG